MNDGLQEMHTVDKVLVVSIFVVCGISNYVSAKRYEKWLKERNREERLLDFFRQHPNY